MRTFKFRAWDKNKKYMFEVIGISWFANHSSIWQVSGYDILEPIDNVDIMQFTGLLDKNGREIFEGDILEVNLTRRDGFCGKVVWRNNGWRIKNIDARPIKESDRIWDMNHENMLIIGNIYESPELLEGKE